MSRAQLVAWSTELEVLDSERRAARLCDTAIAAQGDAKGITAAVESLQPSKRVAVDKGRKSSKRAGRR